MSDSAFSACYLYALCRDTAQTGNRYLNKSGLICLTLLLVLITLPAAQLSAADPLYAGGSGTAEDPYLIETEAQFLDIAANSGAHFLLLNNITVTQRTGANLTGVFNGGGHNIHVSVNAGDVTNSGLFSSLSGSGTVRNVTFTGTYNTGSGDNSGLVAGNMSGSSLIEDVISRVNFTKSGSGGNTGGIVGSMSGGTIIRTVSTGNTVGNVTVGGITGFGTGGLIEQSLNTGNVHATGGNGSGGITGGSQAGTVRDSYSTGAVTGSISCGGAFGYITNAAVIERVYSAGAANCSVTSSGGFVGQRTGGTVSHVFYDLNRSILFTDPVAQGLSGARMRMASFFTGFDFDDIWQMHPDFPSYPLLRSLSYNEPFSSPAVLPIPGLLEEPMFASGTGTAEDPFVITSGAHVQNIGHNSSTHYLLANDVLVSQRTNIPFAGVLEGSGNTITLNFNLGNVNETGLFRLIRGSGTVRNLIIDGNISQSGGSITGSVAADMFNTSLLYRVISRVEINAGSTSVIGGLVARLYEGTIRESAFMGSISAPSGGTIGGLAAQINWSGSLIERSFNTGTLTAQSNGGWVGGIAATMNAGTVLDSFSTGTISAFANCGGAFAAVTSTISPITVTRVYAAGLVNCDGWNTGGLVGQSNATVSASFYDVDATGKTSSARGTGLTGEEMRTRTFFEDAGWVFEGENASWAMLEAPLQSYPFLVWFDYDSQTDPPGYLSPFSGGKGTSADPYRIETEAHFLNISLAPAAHFLLMNNITVTERTGTALTGVFNGGGHTIHVSVNAGDVTDSGLFSSLSGSGTVRNVTFTGTYTTGAGDNSGLVAGSMSGSSLIEDVISRVNFTKSASNLNTGGLVGRMTGGTISRSAVTGNITATFPVAMGGIAGHVRGGLIQQSFVSGTLSTSSANGVGGIVGDVGDATIEDVYFNGTISAFGSINCAAGFGLSVSGSVIRRVYIAASVNCGPHTFNGVFVGQLGGGSITNSYYDLNLAAEVDTKAGTGLSAARMRTESSFSGFSFGGSNPVWMMHPDFPSFPYLKFFDYDEPFQTPPVFPIPGLLSEPMFAGGDGTPATPYLIETATHFSNIGNFSPTHYLLLNDVTLNQMTNLSFAGILEGGDNTITIGISQGDVSNAGLFRRLTGNAVVRNLTMTGTFTQTAGQIAGGFAAIMDGNSLIERVVSYVNVSAGGTFTVGAVVGEQRGGTIRYAASFGNTTASTGIGGLVGNQTGGLIEFVFNAGVITATGGNSAGGIVGSTRNSTIRDSYSIGRINSQLNCGGAIGIVSSGSTVTRIYAAGLVNCDFPSNVGGLVGQNNGNVTDSFYDTQATGKSSSAGGTGLTTAQMRTRTPFVNAGWVFEGENAPWNTLSVFQSYPFLRAFTYDNVFDPPETPVFPVPGLFNPFAGGFGSEASPFLISEEAHFMSIVGDAGFFYLLQNDITVTQMTGLAFRGDFDGGGNNIHVDIDAGIGQNAGLFRILHSGKVRNLRLSGHLRALNPQFTGLIAAEAFGNARIQNVHSSAWVEVTGTLQGYATGGLTGRMTNSWIQNSSVTGTTEGIQNVGGLAGLVEASSLIERSYNTGTIIASLEIAGGLTGRLAGGTVRDSYSTGAIQSSYYCGGAIGFSQFTNLVERIFATGFIDCILLPMVPPSGGLIAIDNNNSTVVNSSYFDADAAGIGWSVGGGEARTSAQMRSGATFAGWDFEDTWQIESGGVRLNYPYLRNLYWEEQQAIPGLIFHTDLEAPAGWQMLVSPAVNTTYGELLSGIWTQGYPGSNHPESNQPNVFWYNESQAGGQWQLPGDSGHLAGTGSASGSNAGRATVAWVFGPLEHNGPVIWPKPLLLGGTEQPGAVSIALSRTSETGEAFAGWHLVGNPFADPLTWNAAAAAAQNGIEPVIYSWDKAAEAHRFVDGRTGAGTRGTAVNPFEGFWVRVAAGENGGTFNAAPAQGGMAGREAADADNDLMQQESGEEAGKLAVLETEPLFIRLETAQQEHFEAVVLELLDFGDDVFYGSPAPLGVPVMQFAFAGAEGFPQASVGRAVITEGLTRSFPLVFDAALSGSFTLEVSGSDGWHDKIQAAVLDHHTGMVHPLSNGGSLSFTHQASAGILQLREQSRSMSPAERLALAQQPQLLTADTRFELQLTRSLPTNLEPENRLPSVITLHQNYPNPFNPTTTIRYALPETAEVRLEVYNVLGQRVAVLVNGTQQAGWHTASFDASRLSSGLYLYRLQAGSYVETRSMILVK
ncbi:MAG: T9SS type A sorting domain-containing protein [Balneolales bacterium]|nr:T9SS type A sorting domain-containing protein [Balneolales bacterium]